MLDETAAFETPHPPRPTLASLPSLTKQSFHPRTLGWATAISCRSHVAPAPFLLPPWSLVHQACSFARQRPSKQTSQSVIEGTERHRNVRMCSVGNASASPRLLFRKTASEQAIFSICGRRRSRRALKCTHLQCLQCKCGYIVSKTVLMLSFHQDTS